MINNILKNVMAMVLIVTLVMACGCIGNDQVSDNGSLSDNSDAISDNIDVVEEIPDDEYIYQKVYVSGFDFELVDETVNIYVDIQLDQQDAEIDEIIITDNIGDEDRPYWEFDEFTIQIMEKIPVNPDNSGNRKIRHMIPIDVSDLEPGQYKLNINGGQDMFEIDEDGNLV